MAAGALSVWVLLIAPTYVVVVKGGASVTTAQVILVAYGLAGASLYGLRYLQGGWRAESLLIEA